MGLSLRPLKKIGEKIGGRDSFLADVFSANTNADIQRRQLAGQPSSYVAQQQQNGVAGRSIAVNPIQRAVVTARGIGEGIVQSPIQLGKWATTTAQQGTRDYVGAQKAQLGLQNVQGQIIASQGKILRDPTASPIAKQRAQRLLQQMSAQSNDTYSNIKQQTTQDLSNLDVRKNLAAGASTIFDLATLGVGSGAQAGLKEASEQGIKAFTKVAAKEGAKAAATGAVSGALSPIVSKGKDATAKEILTGAATGAAVGGILPVAQYGATKVIKGAVKGAEKTHLKALMSPEDYNTWEDLVISRANADTKGKADLVAVYDEKINRLHEKYSGKDQVGGGGLGNEPTIKNPLTGETVDNPNYVKPQATTPPVGKTAGYLDETTSQRVLNNKIQPEADLWRKWFHNSDHTVLPEIEKRIQANPEIKDAGVSRMYDYYKKILGEDISFDEFLNKDITLYRGGNTRATNDMASYSLLERKAKRFGDVNSITVKPKDTYGMLGDFSEGEVFVPNKTSVAPPVGKTHPLESLKAEADQGKVFYHGTSDKNLKSLSDLQAGSGVGKSGRNRVYVTENPEIAKNFGDNVIEQRLYGKHLDVRDIGVEKTPGWAQDNVVSPEFADYKTTKLLTEREKRVFENQFVKGVPNNTIIEDTPGIHKYLASKGYTTITVPRTISDVNGIRSETIIIDNGAFKKPQATPKQKPVVSSMAQGKVVEATPTPQKSIQELVMGDAKEANFGTSRITDKGILERGASAVTGGVQDLLQRGTKASLTSGNKLLRTPGRAAVGITKEAAMNADEAAQVAAASGTKQVGQDVAETLYAQGAKLEQASKTNIGNHLDPELAARKGQTLKPLSPAEQVEFDRLRNINDQIHEENYRLGLIDQKQYNANKGSYFGRDFTAAFDEKDLRQMGRSLGIDKTFFKHRKDLNEIADEVIAAASEDPHLITAKRIQNLEANRAYIQQSNWLADSGRAIDTPKSGYIQVPDAPKYGGLQGKYVLKEDLENLDGFIYDTKVAQNLNDLITLYDRNPVRQTRKMILTVLNPAVRLGNVTSNATFAWLNGINPATLAKNWSVGKKMMVSKSPEYMEAAKQGIFGSSIMDKEFQRVADEIGDSNRGKFAQWLENRKNSYGATDDHAKMAAYITHRQRGMTKEQAAQEVRRGFQNYDMVGYLYDISAKTPIGGKAFGRFGSELVRIMSNAAADRPLRTAGTVAGIATLGTLLSRLSGETPEDRKTREERLGAARIPFTNVSLSFQTPAGEVNMARLLGITTYNDVNGGLANEASRLGPFDMPFSASIGGRDKGGPKQLVDVDAKAQALTGDPIVGPLLQLGMNKDFRGKEITNTAAPTGERAKDALRYLQQSYVPYMNEADSLRAATNYEKQGRPDVSKLTPEQQASVSNYYDKVRTLPQAIGRTLGVKTEQFGPNEAAAARQKQTEFELRRAEAEQNNLIKSEKETAKYLSDKGKPTVTTKGGGSSNPKVTQLSNGSFYAPSIKSGQKEFDTQQEADLAVAKDEFKKSDSKIKTVGDTVFYKTKDGTVKSEPKLRYDATKEITSLDLQLDRTKRSDNLNGWLDAAQKKWDALEKKKALYDPETESDEIIKLVNAQEDLQTQAEKFKEYGGFKKGGFGSGGKRSGGFSTASMGVSVSPTSSARNRPTVNTRGGQIRSVASKGASRPTVTVKKSRV